MTASSFYRYSTDFTAETRANVDLYSSLQLNAALGAGDSVCAGSESRESNRCANAPTFDHDAVGVVAAAVGPPTAGLSVQGALSSAA